MACSASASSEGFCLACCRTAQGWTSRSLVGAERERGGRPAWGGGQGRAGHLLAPALARPRHLPRKPLCCLWGVSINQTAAHPALLFLSQILEYERLGSAEKKIIVGNCPIRKVKCCLVAGTCSCRVPGAQTEDRTEVSNSYSLSHSAGAKPAKKLPCRRFRARKRLALSIQMCEGTVDLLATGHCVGKEKDRIQGGISPTQSQKSLKKQRPPQWGSGRRHLRLFVFLTPVPEHPLRLQRLELFSSFPQYL